MWPYLLTAVNALSAIISVAMASKCQEHKRTAEMAKESAVRHHNWTQGDYHHIRDIANKFGKI